MKRLLWLLLILILGLGGYYIYYSYLDKHTSISFNVKIPNGFESIGIDVSHHQGEINWNKLLRTKNDTDSITFVYCKATEGKNHTDSQWNRNRTWLKKNGVKHGAYHFFSTKSYAKPQAEHFLNHWKKSNNDLPPVLDVETEGISDADLIAKMKIWLTIVEAKSGLRPIIYTSHHFYSTKFKNAFPDYKFWIAAYSRKPLSIKNKQVIHWQFTERARVNGTAYNVDLNVSKIKF